jgi:hypothetical protein
VWPTRRIPPPSPTAHPETAGAAYEQLIESELREETRRKDSIERRGASLVTTTGVIVGVAFAFAPALQGKTISLPAESIAYLTFGGLSLALAIIFGIVANIPAGYEVAETESLRRLVDERFWVGPRSLGSRRVAEVRVDEIASARAANADKSRWLRRGLTFQAIGIMLLGFAALFVLIRNL